MLSKKCKYALKALEYLAKQKNATPVLIAEISEKQKIPKKFLEVILLELKHDGIVQSKMGKHGGYYLIKKPADINIGHIIRLIDGPVALLPCVSYKYYQPCDDCEDEATCGLHHVLAKIREANNKILGNVSLAGMINFK
ncbi:MAG: Rrf2 family transcriptional regulator [Bacteroidia bacterium]|nr:Rrf2 family transcriptional regulator [Bacteroidia bacterium]HQV01777.1 Rrf2 family transcriptional regulator [Bacteroidia bacterium]